MKLNCINNCKDAKKSCEDKECKNWIDYPNELNCINISIERNGPLNLSQIAERLHSTTSRIHQIEKAALAKIREFSEEIDYL